MKVGDLVKPRQDGPKDSTGTIVPDAWVGIVIDLIKPWEDAFAKSPLDHRVHPVIYWDDEYPAEVEYPEQLEIISQK